MIQVRHHNASHVITRIVSMTWVRSDSRSWAKQKWWLVPHCFKLGIASDFHIMPPTLSYGSFEDTMHIDFEMFHFQIEDL